MVISNNDFKGACDSNDSFVGSKAGSIKKLATFYVYAIRNNVPVDELLRMADHLDIIKAEIKKFKDDVILRFEFSDITNMFELRGTFDKPKQFFVLYTKAPKVVNSKGMLMQFYTDCEHTAEGKKIKHNGEMYIDTRYKAKLRLYWYLYRKLFVNL